jgi:hypothetical protein
MIITEVNGKEILDDLFSSRDKQLDNEQQNKDNKHKSLVESMNQLEIKETKEKKQKKPRKKKSDS